MQKRRGTATMWWLAAFAMMLVCGPRRPQADEKSDLLSKIEDKLEDAADALERLPGDSDDSAIRRANDYVSEARRYADDLGRIAGDDSSARRIAEDFDDYQDDWKDASDQLRQLKAGMRKGEPVAQMCTERDKELVKKAREYESRNDPEGIAELPREAAAAQDTVKRQLDDLRRHDDAMDDYADRADDFRANAPWGDLVSSVASTSRKAFELWRKQLEQTQRTCENLAKGVDHPDVKEVLTRLASSAGGRKALIEQITINARELTDALSRVSDDSSLSSIERAKSELAELRRDIENLARIPTTDRVAKALLEKLPGDLRQFDEAIDDLEDLKRHQHDMDPLPEKCQLKERELTDAIARNGDDPDGVEAIEQLAESFAEPVRAGLAKADERMREESDDLARAKAVSPSDPTLSDARSAMQREADKTYKTYEDGNKKTKEACELIVKGKGGPIVSKAVKALQDRAASSGDALDREVVSWIEAARGVYIMDCKAMEDVWKAYCGTDFEPGDDSSADDQAEQIASQWKSDFAARAEPVRRKLEDLKPRIQALVKKRATRSRGETLLAAVTKEEQRLARLEAREVWRGSYNLLSQYASQYGKDRHAAEHDANDCMVPRTANEVAVFGSGEHTKPDCIIARAGKCEIIEFKPEGTRAESEGQKQLGAYVRSVPEYYNQFVKAGAPDDSRGGEPFIKELRTHCIVNGVFVLKIRLKQYNMCKGQYVCESQ